MSLESNVNLDIITNEKNNNQSNEMSIKIKNILKKILQNSLSTQLLKLESKSSDDFSNFKIIKKNFDDFSKKINYFQKKVEETIKKKEKEKEKAKKLSLKNDKKIYDNNKKKRTLSSNSIKISFNNKSHKTIMTEDEIEKTDNSKNLLTVERGKTQRSNKIQIRTISNFRTTQNKEKEKEKTKEKEKEKIESYKNQKKGKGIEGTNLKKYKTSINKNSFKKGLINQNDNLFLNTINKINIKKYEGSRLNNSAKNSKIIKGANYSYDRIEGKTLSDIEEKTEKKHNNNSSFTRKNKFKDKEEKKSIVINKIRPENKNDKKINTSNKKIQISINNENLSNNKQDIPLENKYNNTISADKEIKYSKSNNLNNNIINKISNGKKDIQLMSVKNIVKLVDDVNQSINKILLDGSQTQFQKRNSIRESSRSFIINKNIEIKEFLNKSLEKIEKVDNEKEKIQSYNDIPNSNDNKNKNLNIKCKINYNVFSNENNVKKINSKNKINNTVTNNNNNITNSNNNNNNHINSSINKAHISKENELKNYNSYKNKKSIKKIILNSNKNKITEDEKNNNSNINNDSTPIIIKEKKINKCFEIIKNKKISFIEIIKDNSKILSTILQYLSFKNKIYFLSVNKYLSKERISLLMNKKEELLLILQLKGKETIEDKIKFLKNSCSTKDFPSKALNDKEFKLSKNTIKNLKQLNENQNIKLFKENQINNNKITEINIIYRILLLLFGEKKLVEISDDNNFWKNTCKYFLNKSVKEKIGNFIIDKAKNFYFDHQTINLIEFILIGNKNNIINGYYEKLCKTTGLIIPLIREALDYCGVIVIDTKNRANRLLDNLQYNQKLINKLDNIINFYSYK